MSRRLFQRFRWIALGAIAAAISGLLALSRPASSALPAPVSLGGGALDSRSVNSELVVITPPVVVFSTDEPADSGLDSPFDDDSIGGGHIDDSGSADSFEDVGTESTDSLDVEH